MPTPPTAPRLLMPSRPMATPWMSDSTEEGYGKKSRTELGDLRNCAVSCKWNGIARRQLEGRLPPSNATFFHVC
jgi:hypothetical protein